MPNNQRRLLVPDGEDPNMIRRAFENIKYYLENVNLTQVADWEAFEAGVDFSTTASDDHTISMTTDRSGIMRPGDGIRVTSGSDTLYAMVNTNTGPGSMTILGPAIATGAGAITGLAAILNEGRMRLERIILPGDWCTGTTNDLMDAILDAELVWRHPSSYLVAAWVKGKSIGGTPAFNISNNSASANNILTSAITVTTSWKDSEALIDKNEYLVDFGSKLYLRCTTAGTGASDTLTIDLMFVESDQTA